MTISYNLSIRPYYRKAMGGFGTIKVVQKSFTTFDFSDTNLIANELTGLKHFVGAQT